MGKEGNHLENFAGLDYDAHGQEQMKLQGVSGDPNCSHVMDYLQHNPPVLLHDHQLQPLSNFCDSSSFDKLSFADVMQSSNFGPKLALNHLSSQSLDDNQEREDKGDGGGGEENTSMQLRFLEENIDKNPLAEGKTKRKRPRSIKTSEEVESQRMTHIAVERNRRKQMNEHLRVLRSLMPSSYVQRGDQASIIGGAIEFVRELEELLQCLESQKRRRPYGDGPNAIEDPTMPEMQQQSTLTFPSMPGLTDQMKLYEYDCCLHEDTAESKSCMADVEVKLLGFDALIKILSRRRPGQLIKAIAALQDMQLTILHTNITTIEQTVLYSFNVKIGGEARFTADDMANSVQQIFSFIHSNSSGM